MPIPRDQWASRRLEDIVDGILYVGPTEPTSGIWPQLCADPGYVTGAGARRADTGGDSLMRKELALLDVGQRPTAAEAVCSSPSAVRSAVGPFARNTPPPRRWRLPPTGVDCSASSRGRAVPRSPSPPSRLLFAMGENDQLPAVFVATHPRFRTPMLAMDSPRRSPLRSRSSAPSSRRSHGFREIAGPVQRGPEVQHVSASSAPSPTATACGGSHCRWTGRRGGKPWSNGTIHFSSKRWTVKNA